MINDSGSSSIFGFIDWEGFFNFDSKEDCNQLMMGTNQTMNWIEVKKNLFGLTVVVCCCVYAYAGCANGAVYL